MSHIPPDVPAKIEVIDAVTLVRRRPQMFFEGGVATREALLAAVLEDAGDGSTIVQEGDWTLVTSRVDWMAGQGIPIAELFERFVVPTPVVGPNRHRSEILLAGRCAGVGTFGPAGDVWLDVERIDIPSGLLSQAIPDGRTLVWRFSADA